MVDALAAALSKMKVGNQVDRASQIGPLPFFGTKIIILDEAPSGYSDASI